MDKTGNVLVKKLFDFDCLFYKTLKKTTTFKMLTTEILPSEGDALISDLSVVSDVDDVKRRIGYCPQFDGLNPSLTAEEHIRYYGKLRGITKSKLELQKRF